MPFKFQPCEIPDIVLIEPKLFLDERGFFLETFKESLFYTHGIPTQFSQDNHSFSKQNVLRGLHYQIPPKEQGKLITVIKGKIWDVAVDIRKESHHFLKWTGTELSDENHLMVYIPPGFAHGFVVLSPEAHVTYKCTSEYDQSLDRGIRWDDPDIGIEWPIKNPILSEKDKQLPSIKETNIVEK